MIRLLEWLDRKASPGGWPTTGEACASREVPEAGATVHSGREGLPRTQLRISEACAWKVCNVNMYIRLRFTRVILSKSDSATLRFFLCRFR